ncbi:hypothetical protein EJB05_33569, partial [Eragrostis curvula]
MAEPPPPSQSPAQTPPQQQAPAAGGREDMLACVAALEAALLPCLPARELQAVDRSLQSAHQSTCPTSSSSPPSPLTLRSARVASVPRRDPWVGVLDSCPWCLARQREDRPTTEEMLRKEITTMEEELKTKAELIAKHKKLIEGWQKELKEQLGKHITELERV